jgi:hypothetical protein
MYQYIISIIPVDNISYNEYFRKDQDKMLCKERNTHRSTDNLTNQSVLLAEKKLEIPDTADFLVRRLIMATVFIYFTLNKSKLQSLEISSSTFFLKFN